MCALFQHLSIIGAVLCLWLQTLALGADPTDRIAQRVPWTQSRLQGSPEPPLPYVFQQAFDIQFDGPVSLNRIPNTNQYLVCEQHGKIYWFDGEQTTPDKKLCADFNARRPPALAQSSAQRLQLLSLTYHPQFANNQWVYVCYVTQGGQQEPQTHISRFQLTLQPVPELVMESELLILTCGGGGHNGCTLLFGPDGYLYISIGDLEVPNPPDPRNTGQDISDLYASILRIDVDRATPSQNYSIPQDNPFVDLPGAAPEVYAYGLRNPFRMSFDALTGDLWVGDVGWEAWEMVYRVRSGGNYGWAIKEGPGDVKTQTPGPTPILPADIALNHAEAASVTGGIVYRGQNYPELTGQYVFGDWITRKFWAARFDEQRVLDYREIAVGKVKPICFETDPHGELLIMDYSEANQAAGIFKLIPNPAASQASHDFPRQLSQTGLFADTAVYKPAAGVVPYSINAPMWADAAHADYLLAVPGEQFVQFHPTPQKIFAWFKTQVELPRGSVLVKTYSLGHPPHAQRIETQIALKDEQGDWQYYSYRWNEAGDDASLVDSAGMMATLELKPSVAAAASEPGSAERLSKLERIDWNFASRASCRVCHTPWTGETIGFTEPQLRAPNAGAQGAPHGRPHATPDSWHHLLTQGVIRSHATGDVGQSSVVENRAQEQPLKPADHLTSLVDPADTTQPIDARARAYLHTNCGHCHLNGGNASTTMDVSFSKLLPDTRMVDQVPMRGDLGIAGAKIVKPGRPAESMLFVRLAKSGAGRMPHIGSQLPDPLGTRLIKQWITQLPVETDILKALDEVCAPLQASVNADQRRKAAFNLLKSYTGAVELAGALAEGRVPQWLIRDIVAHAQLQDPAVRELLEPYAAEDQRVQRLGENFAPDPILALSGSAKAGKELFAQGVGTCSSCHRLEGIGKELGPNLSSLTAARRTPEMLLKSIMSPALEIDEAYKVISVLDDAGQVLVGRKLHRDDQHLVLQDAAGNTQSIALASIEQERSLPNSLMPDQLLSPLTAQQAADLLAYLSGLSTEK